MTGRGLSFQVVCAGLLAACAELGQDGEECGPAPDGCIGEAECEMENSTCGGDVWECRDGAWKRIGYCDPAPPGPIVGDVNLYIGLGDPLPEACPVGMIPRTPLVITGAEDGTFTAVAPTVIIEQSFDEWERTARLEIADEWDARDGAVAVTLAFDLLFEDGGLISGDGQVSASPECVIDAEIGGDYVEP